MWNTYKLRYVKLLAVEIFSGIDGRYPDSEWTDTNITTRARSLDEAMKKFRKLWRENEYSPAFIDCVMLLNPLEEI